MQSAVDNGFILKTDIDVMTTEKIKLRQQLRENEIRKASLLRILSDLTGMEIDPASELQMPAVPSELSGELSRPELEVFDLRKEQLAASLKIIKQQKNAKSLRICHTWLWQSSGK